MDIIQSENNVNSLSETSEVIEEIVKPLTFVDLKTHVRFDLPNILILKTKNLLKSEVEDCISRGIDFATYSGEFTFTSNFFFNN